MARSSVRGNPSAPDRDRGASCNAVTVILRWCTDRGSWLSLRHNAVGRYRAHRIAVRRAGGRAVREPGGSGVLKIETRQDPRPSSPPSERRPIGPGGGRTDRSEGEITVSAISATLNASFRLSLLDSRRRRERDGRRDIAFSGVPTVTAQRGGGWINRRGCPGVRLQCILLPST